MIRPICKDIFFLGQKSLPATPADIPTGVDLNDTLDAHADCCVGMAANMIGVRKNIIIAVIDDENVVMFNPVITEKSGRYETEEGCLSLSGERKTERFENITVEYYDFSWKKQVRKLTGFAAEIVQHEVDHLSGKII